MGIAKEVELHHTIYKHRVRTKTIAAQQKRVSFFHRMVCNDSLIPDGAGDRPLPLPLLVVLVVLPRMCWCLLCDL